MILTSLPSAWKSGVPASTTVEQDLRAYRQKLGDAVDNTIKQAASQRPQAAVDRLAELADLFKSAEDMIAHAIAANWPVNTLDVLKQFEKELSHWRFVILGAAGGEAQNNARARYADAGAWAVHFSIVRMTVSTFLITAAWGAVSLKWDEYSRPLVCAALCLWCLAGFFLFVFTRATFDRSSKQKEWQAVLPVSRKNKPHSTSTTLSSKTWRSIWMPFWMYLFVSVLYLLLLDSWAQHGADPCVTWPAFLKPGAEQIKQKPTDRLVDSVGKIGVTLQGIADSLAGNAPDVRGRSGPTSPGSSATPTPTPTPTATSTSDPRNRD